MNDQAKQFRAWWDEFRKLVPLQDMAFQAFTEVPEVASEEDLTFEYGKYLRPLLKFVRIHDRAHGTRFVMRQLTPRSGELALDWFTRCTKAVIAHVHPRPQN